MKMTNTRDVASSKERIQDIYFEQCVDFLARMIEKYGDTISLDGEKKTA